MGKITFGILFTALSLAFPVRAKTNYVDAAHGSDTNDGLTRATALRTLQCGADLANDGDVVLLADGVYEPVEVHRNVAFSIVGEHGRDHVFVDGGGTNRCCFIASNAGSNSANWSRRVTVTGITFYNGYTHRLGTIGYEGYGGGVFGGTLYDCRILGCRADVSGGAAAGSLIHRCELRDCRSASAGAATIGCEIHDSLIAGNLNCGGLVTSWWYSDKESFVFSSTSVYNSTVVNNHSTLGAMNYFRCVGFYYGQCIGGSMMMNNIVYYNGKLYGDPFYEATPSSLNGTVWNEDPGFRNMSAGLYTLKEGASRTDVGCFPGVDTKDYVYAKAKGPGCVLWQTAYIDAQGKAMLKAIDFNHRFSHWESTAGEVQSTALELDLENAVSGSGYVAVFTNCVHQVDGSDPDGIQKSIDLACDGDTIQVAAGVYHPIAENTKGMTIVGAGAGRSIIDGGHTNRCATFHSYTNHVTLMGFTLRNGFSYDGGGVLFGRVVACEIVDNEIKAGGNGADTNYGGGGAAYARLESCVVARNKSNGEGAGIMWGALYNCTVVANVSEYRNYYGYCGASGSPAYNSIIQRNRWYDGSMPDVNWWGSGSDNYNSNDDCGLVDPDNGDYRPRKGAKVLGAGKLKHLSSDVDITLSPRSDGKTISLGAYETAQFDGWVVKSTISGTGRLAVPTATCSDDGSVTFEAVETVRPFSHFETNGVVVGTAKTITFDHVHGDFVVTAVFTPKVHEVGVGQEYADLQSAVNAAFAGEEIRVHPGVYGPVDTLEKRLRLTSTGGRDVTIIDGGGTSRCANLGTTSDNGSTMTGFTLRNGFDSSRGGGTYYGALVDCAVAHCCASNDASCALGGGTFYTNLRNCLIISNVVYSGKSYGEGGGFYLGDTYNTKVVGNQIFAYDGDNSGGAGGRGYYLSHHVNMLFVGNRLVVGINGGYGEGAGGATNCGNFENCTYVNNRAEAVGAATAIAGGFYSYNGTSNGRNLHGLSYGNIPDSEYANPLFVDPEGGDYRLLEGSYAINNTGYTGSAYATDLAGNPRVVDGMLDSGCYEGAVVPTNVPGRATGFAVSLDGVVGAIALTWKSAPYATSYKIWRSASADGSGAMLLATTTELKYTDSSVEEGADWYYYVQPANGVGLGEATAVQQGRAASPLRIVTTSLAGAVLNAGYETTLSAVGGGGRYIWEQVVEKPYDITAVEHPQETGFDVTNVGYYDYHYGNHAWHVTLPFPFHFYDKIYTTAIVNAGGVISFENPYTDYEMYDKRLAKTIGVAAMNACATITNICWKTTDDTFTVRWLGYHYNYATGAYDVTATLYRNGNIVVHYGENSVIRGVSGISNGCGSFQGYFGLDYPYNYPAAGSSVVYDRNTAHHLPFDLSLSEDGVISGIPQEPGQKTLTLRVTDQYGNTDTATMTLTVGEDKIKEREFGAVVMTFAGKTAVVGTGALAGTNFVVRLDNGKVSAATTNDLLAATSVQRIIFTGDVTVIGPEYLSLAATDLACVTTEVENVYMNGNYVLDFGKGEFDFSEDKQEVVIPAPQPEERGGGSSDLTGGGLSGNTNITEVTICKGITSIGEAYFRDCSELTSITIPATVTNIGAYAFAGCLKLKDVYFVGLREPATIGENAFATTPATCMGHISTKADAKNFTTCSAWMRFVYENGSWLAYVENGQAVIARYKGSASTIAIPKKFGSTSVTTIGTNAFAGCSLTKITIPSHVTRIRDRAFAGSPRLKSVTIKGVLTELGDDVFADCPLLTEIFVTGSAPSGAKTPFNGIAEGTKIYVPGGATGWSDLVDDPEERIRTQMEDVVIDFSKLLSASASNSRRMLAASATASSFTLPGTWLTQVANSGHFDSNLTASQLAFTTAANGAYRVYECYIAGTDPTDETDFFTSDIYYDEDTGELVVSWQPRLNDEDEDMRIYTFDGKENLSDGWTPDIEAFGDYHFFRVNVQMKTTE